MLENQTVRVLFINNNGGGFAERIEVPAGTTLADFLEQRLPGYCPSNYLIRLNRQAATADSVLNDGDRVSATPIKIEGA